ncbi:DUF7344 domain-containing protein [Natrinema sp. LN54]|uniref:DUF7344 domain-containing protein n=1 Tax=Natrinema sp. LN54 TaxID=3458705 RepID=UPI0040371724
MADRHADGDEKRNSIDLSFAALSDPCRRSLCRYAMRTGTESVASEDLVDYVIERAPETGSAEPDRRAVETELRHVHLPKLDEAGMVDYDRQSGVVHVDRATVAKRLEDVRAAVADLQDGAAVR